MHRRLARFNRLVTNRLARPLAGWLPPFALVSHTGRRSGRPYRTPVWIFRDGDRDQWIVALTYGAEAEWVQNVRKRGTCTIEHRGRQRHMSVVGVVQADPESLPLPVVVRRVLGVLGIDAFLVLEADGRPVTRGKEEGPNG